MRSLISSVQRISGFTAMLLIVCGWYGTAVGQSGTWTDADGDGAWGDTANWSGGTIANGSGNTADFSTVDVDGNVVNANFPGFYRNAINLDSTRTIGNMTFGDSNTATPGGWEVFTAASTLTLAGATPTITVNPLGPYVAPAETIDDAIIRPAVDGTQGLTKAGAGILTFAGPYNVTGGINVTGGTLRLRQVLPAANQEQLVNLANGTTIESLGALRNVHVAAGGTATVRLTAATQFGGVVPDGPGSTLNVRNTTTGQVEVARDWAGFQNVNLIGEAGTATGYRFQINSNITAANVFNGNSFANTNLHLDNTNIFVRSNSQGNTLPIGQLTGTSTGILSGGNTGTAVRWEIGGLNTSSTFSGQLNGAGGQSINKVGTGTLTFAGPFSATSPAISSTPARQGGVYRVTTGTMRFTGVNSIPGGPVANPTVLTTIDVLPGATFDVSGSPGGTFTTQSQQKIQGGGTILGNWIHAGGAVPGRIQPGDVGAPTAANEGNMSAGVTPTAGTLTFSGNLELSGGDILHDTGLTPASGNDLVQVTGITTLTSGRIRPRFALDAVPAGLQTYTVLNSTGGFSGAAANLVVDFPGRGANVTPFTTGNDLQFTMPEDFEVITADISWTGSVNGVWDIETTNNWNNGGSADKYFDFDDITFPEAGTTTKTITLNAPVEPGSIVMNNTSTYAFSGNGSIFGATGFTKTGGGQLNMNLNNTFTGPASITGSTVSVGAFTGLGSGPLTLSNATYLSTISMSNSALDIPAGTTSTIQLDGGAGTGGTANIPSLTGDGTLNLTSIVIDKFFGTFTTTGFTGTLNVGPTAPATDLGEMRIRAGQTDFSNAVVNLTSTGVSNQQGGGGGTTVTVGFGELHGDAGSSLIAFNGGSATFPNINWEIGALDTNSNVAGVIADGGGAISNLTKVGTGTLTLTGANTYTGNTTVEEGTLSINSAYLAGTADVIISTGAILDLNFAGTDDIDSLYLDTTSQAIGLYGAIGNAGATFQVPYITGTGLLNVQTVGPPLTLPGDYNADGTVDAADYVFWRLNDGTQAGYDLWAANFGLTQGAGSSAGSIDSNAAVPEPATALLAVLVLGLCCGAWHRR
jgi:autotransporter-associated beta strand protein